MKTAFPYTTQGNLIGAGVGFPSQQPQQIGMKTMNPTESMLSMQSLHNSSAGGATNGSQQKLLHAAAMAANASTGGHIFIDMPSNKQSQGTTSMSGNGTGNKKVSSKA